MALTNNTGKIFYRIKQVDNDGRYTLSSIVNISVKAGQVLQVWPNPASDQFNINISANGAQMTAIILLDVNGKLLLTRPASLTLGNQCGIC